MHNLSPTGRGSTIERSFCLGMSLWLAACSAEMTPSMGAATSRDPQTASGTSGALDDNADGGMVTRGAGMPIKPIHRADAGTVGADAAVPVGNAPVRSDAGVGLDAAAQLPPAEPDAGPAPAEPAEPAEPTPDAGATLPPGAALPLPEPTRRYSFDGGGANSPDLAGGADAVVRGNAMLDGNGAVSFPGQGDGFVELPSDVLDGATSFTVLVWLSVSSEACWQRAFDLMLRQETNAGPLQTSLFLTPYGCPDSLPTLGYVTGNAKFHLIGENKIATGELLQLGASFSARSQTLRLIVNGVVQKEQSVPVDTRTLQRARGILGRSELGDPQLRGSISELRVYDSRLEPEQLQAIYTRGPDAL